LKSFSAGLMFGVAVTVATPAAAQITFESQATAPAAPLAAKPSNPTNDKMICEREDVIGSRLGAKKVCKTAAQWQEERRQQRETLEKVQQQGDGVGGLNTNG